MCTEMVVVVVGPVEGSNLLIVVRLVIFLWCQSPVACDHAVSFFCNAIVLDIEGNMTMIILSFMHWWLIWLQSVVPSVVNLAFPERCFFCAIIIRCLISLWTVSLWYYHWFLLYPEIDWKKLSTGPLKLPGSSMLEIVFRLP